MTKTTFILFLVLIAANFGCQNDCKDCGPLQNNLFVNIDFINQTGIDSLDQADSIISIERFSENSRNDSLLNSITDMNSSFSEIQSEIDNGNDNLIDELNALKLEIEQTTDSQRIQELKVDSITKILTGIRQSISKMENATIRLNSISTSISETALLTFEDSTNDYKLPFSNDTSIHETVFTIDIENVKRDITVNYESDIIVDNSMAIRTYIFGLDSTTIDKGEFDSLKLNCKDSICISNEATITVYF